jgi:hypothetical protein
MNPFLCHALLACLAGLSLKSQELTAIFLAVRLYCSLVMEKDIHTVLDSATLITTLWVIYTMRFKLKSTLVEDLDNLPIYYVVSFHFTPSHNPFLSLWRWWLKHQQWIMFCSRTVMQVFKQSVSQSILISTSVGYLWPSFRNWFVSAEMVRESLPLESVVAGQTFGVLKQFFHKLHSLLTMHFVSVKMVIEALTLKNVL